MNYNFEPSGHSTDPEVAKNRVHERFTYYIPSQSALQVIWATGEPRMFPTVAFHKDQKVVVLIIIHLSHSW